jgi:hypothetical protein
MAVFYFYIGIFAIIATVAAIVGDAIEKLTRGF